MSKTNIFVIANSIAYKKTISGGDILFPEINKRLDSNKYEVKTMTTRLGYELWTRLGAKPEFSVLPSETLDRSASPAIIPLLYMIRAFLACFLLKHLETPSIIYTSSDFICDTFPALFAKLINNRTFWVARVYHVVLPPIHRRGNTFINFLSFLGQRLSFVIIKRKADLIITLSGTFDLLIKLKFPKDKLTVLNGGIDIKGIDAIPAPNIKVYDGIFVGRLHATKGIFDVIEIWRHVIERKKDAKLAIVGGGPESLIKSIKERIQRYGLQINIDFLGFIPDYKDLYHVLKSSRVYIDPEEEGGWSLSSYEAMACKLPVVGYDIFGIVFKQGFVTVPVYITEKFADAVLDLLKDDKRREKLAEEAYQESRGHDWQNVADQFDGLVNSEYLRSQLEKFNR
jgi:glycosyltransferase involved in cell wall biosynthesis